MTVSMSQNHQVGTIPVLELILRKTLWRAVRKPGYCAAWARRRTQVDQASHAQLSTSGQGQ